MKDDGGRERTTTRRGGDAEQQQQHGGARYPHARRLVGDLKIEPFTGLSSSIVAWLIMKALGRKSKRFRFRSTLHYTQFVVERACRASSRESYSLR